VATKKGLSSRELCSGSMVLLITHKYVYVASAAGRHVFATHLLRYQKRGDQGYVTYRDISYMAWKGIDVIMCIKLRAC
jgi:hypothetical protein